MEVVDSLENKISKLLHKLEILHQTNTRLGEEMTILEKDHEKTRQYVVEWEEKYNSLKMANSMLGSNTHKTEAKLKINALIRELDHCMAQLAE